MESRQGKKYNAERGASILPVLKDKEAIILEMSKYNKMLSLLLKGRADAVAIIEGALEDSTTRFPTYRQRIEKSEVPVVERVGYIMFSKRLYQEHAVMIECF